MNTAKVKIQKLPHFQGELPAYQTKLAAGFDIRAQIPAPTVMKPGEKALINTGLIFEIPPGFELQARPRSGLASKHAVTVLNSPGTIDADYRGEVKILLINLGTQDFTVQPQERIAQLVLAPVWQAEFELHTELSATERGASGFGSTGLA